jgi:hypothetical protein
LLEGDHALRWTRQVGDDEADAGIKRRSSIRDAEDEARRRHREFQRSSSPPLRDSKTGGPLRACDRLESQNFPGYNLSPPRSPAGFCLNPKESQHNSGLGGTLSCSCDE